MPSAIFGRKRIQRNTSTGPKRTNWCCRTSGPRFEHLLAISELKRQKAHELQITTFVIRKLKSGEYRLYSRKKNPKTGKRRNLGTFSTREAAEKHERAGQYFKRH
jgi:hypothetical protein